MKAIILLIFILSVGTVAYCNPSEMVVNFVSEVWFADNGHLMVEFDPMNIGNINLNDVTFIHGDFQETFPDSIELSYDSTPLVIDISERMPNMVFSPVEDSLKILFSPCGDYPFDEYLKWGNSFTADINPPLPGQSMARYIKLEENLWSPHYLFFGSSFLVMRWVKEAQPTPGINSYEQVSRAVIKVTITDQNDRPVKYAPIYNYKGGMYNIFADKDGVYTDTLLTGKFHLKIKSPENNEVLFDQYYWLEPGQTMEIPVNVNTGSGTQHYKAPNSLLAFPTPFDMKHTQAKSLCFRYVGLEKMNSSSHIKVYDIKGRFVCKVPISQYGFSQWSIDRQLRAGIYFARLINKNRVINTTTFTIINSLEPRQ